MNNSDESWQSAKLTRAQVWKSMIGGLASTTTGNAAAAANKDKRHLIKRAGFAL